jgi:hypothetical protein
MQEQSAINRNEATAEPNKEKEVEVVIFADLKESLDEHGLPVLPTGDAQKDKEIKELHKIIKQERSHGQWGK